MNGDESDTRLRMAAGLNWDYDVRPEELLAVIDGRLEKAGPFDRNRLLVRSGLLSHRWDRPQPGVRQP